MKQIFNLFIGIIISLFIAPGVIFADEEIDFMKLKSGMNVWKVNIKKSEWLQNYVKPKWNNIDVKFPEYIDEDVRFEASKYIVNGNARGVDKIAVRDYLNLNIAPNINTEKSDVTIDMTNDGKVFFEGFAAKGQTLNTDLAIQLIKNAYAKNIDEVRLPVAILNPNIDINTPELYKKGITSLLATGETDFKGSPSNRMNNIRVGLESFNGKLLAPNSEGGTGETLGRVDASTGYLPELVIKGDKTIPEYGGGLCQVSTTIYRSVLLAGLPITERRSHSYAVSYYDPQGLDSTIYPPEVDLKFKNDTPNWILFQTKTDGTKAYSNIYGSSDGRRVELLGPEYYNYKDAPPPRIEYSDKLPKGEEQIVGGQHDGFEASWYRRLRFPGKEDIIEHIYSFYEARPLYTIIGAGVTEEKGVFSTDEDESE